MNDQFRSFLKNLRDPPEYVIDALTGMDARQQTETEENVVIGARADAIEKWQKAIDELIYRA